MGAFWDWFAAFGEFFTVVYAPLVLAALPLLVVEGVVLAVVLVFLDSFIKRG